MTFDVLEKSPGVAPLLVRLYDTHNLYSMAENKTSDGACFELTAIMVDLLSISLTDKESELITDVVLALMKQAEKDLKAALAERISTMENIPLRMVLGLANEDISVADPILRQSPLLQDLDLLYILQSKGASHGRSIALRSGLSGAVINMLVDTKDFQTAVNLCGNNGLSLTQHAFQILSDMAKNDETLSRPLLSREDLPQEIAGKLYDFVGEELKKTLQARYGIGSEKIAAAIDQITDELRKPDALKYNGGDELMMMAHNQQRRGELKITGIIGTLRRGQYATFMAQFAVFCGLSFDTMKTIVRQEGGKNFATACKAMDLQKPDYVSLYLLTERFRTGSKRMVSHAELTRIMTMYDEIDAQVARTILKNSRN